MRARCELIQNCAGAFATFVLVKRRADDIEAVKDVSVNCARHQLRAILLKAAHIEIDICVLNGTRAADGRFVSAKSGAENFCLGREMKQVELRPPEFCGRCANSK